MPILTETVPVRRTRRWWGLIAMLMALLLPFGLVGTGWAILRALAYGTRIYYAPYGLGGVLADRVRIPRNQLPIIRAQGTAPTWVGRLGVRFYLGDERYTLMAG